MTAFFDFADRHPLMATMWVIAVAFAFCHQPFKLVTFKRNVFERVDGKKPGSEE